MTHILAIDQGTTSSRAILFDAHLDPVASAQQEFTQYFPNSGWVEHDADEIWATTLACCQKVMEHPRSASTTSIGITNQRETVVVWDRQTGKPIGNAIVWQDRRTASFCDDLRQQGLDGMVADKTGLLLDPYFSASKIGWMLGHIPGARQQADAGKLLVGTIDTFLIWRLTGGRVHATDATNASRTMLYDIGRGCWDDDLLNLFQIPRPMLPEVKDSTDDFGETDAALLGRAIPIRAVAGDQQAATVGQACFQPGMLKSTYGTGCFALLNTGADRVKSQNRLLTTIAYQIGGKPTYALEGSIFVAGSAVQWLRDTMGLLPDAASAGAFARAADDAQNVILVPAFTGLGAPYWNAECRGAIFGMTRATGPNELARAALQSVAFQTRDLIEAMHADWPGGYETVLRVDGGMAASNWTMQAVADQLAAPVDRPKVLETTARGAAYLAGLADSMFPAPEAMETEWSRDIRFEPQLDEKERHLSYQRWKSAVSQAMGYSG